MSDIRGYTEQKAPTFGAEGIPRGVRLTRDGAMVQLPWIQSLVMAGRVYGIHAGTVTTPIAGHAAIDADQPEAAVYVADGTCLIPITIRAAMETGATTLAQGGMMAAFSGISVGAGTSTATTPFALNLQNINTPNASAAAAYTGNGTDPLTAGNYIEAARVSAVIDADAATTGIVPPTLLWSANQDGYAPLIQDAGSILVYGEAAANTLYATIVWAELPETAVQ